MQPHRIHARFFIDFPPALSLSSIVPVFHRWIQVGRTDELLLDVADYRHVHQGPGIVLVGHEADYAVDTAGGRIGLRYVRKRDLPETLDEALLQAIRAAARGARLLLEDLAVDTGRIGAEVFEVTIVDPLQYPNDDTNLWRVAKALTHVFQAAGLGAPDVVRASADPREPLTLQVSGTGVVDVRAYEEILVAGIGALAVAQTEGRHEIA